MLIDTLRKAGYEPRRREVLALAGALGRRSGGARALLLEGPPGAGKTFLAEALAKGLGTPFVYALLHSWTDSDELFVGIDVAAAVAGEATAVRQDGVLARAARLSHEAEPGRPVIVLLDEIDKTPERVECLLLDWLQSGRVPLRPGEQLQTRLDSVLVFLTSNGMRPLSDALLRRVRRVPMEPLTVEQAEKILMTRTEAPAELVRICYKALREVAESEGTILSLQEAQNCLLELKVAESVVDLREVIAGWGARSSKGREAVNKCRFIEPLWGELAKLRRKGR